MYRYACTAGLAAAVAALAGCGGNNLVPAEGTVTLDGNPVDGAMVTFVATEGGALYTGQTDASGAFKLTHRNDPGAPPGSYKVMVTKTSGIVGGEGTKPDGADYFKMMQKEKDEAKAATKAAGAALKAPGGAPPPGMKAMGPPGMPMPGGPGGGPPGAAPPPKTELPQMYASVEKSGLTATVEPGGSKNIAIKLTTPETGKKK